MSKSLDASMAAGPRPLPQHLQKYLVEQYYDQYTPVDHAVWRYILRQLRHFLGQHAHEAYLAGLEKTGISIDRIPRISEISEKLAHFGWKAIPVSGFIPPAAFMELQSLGYLPIASAMRSLDHLLYTPAPDIVHEAAGHAPILIQPEYAQYLREYAQVAKKAIISSEDLAVYEAIRHLSDIKENPDSTPAEIEKAQAELESVSKAVSHVSEASELGRMNWWTAEYGLIGDLQNPKIFGAGLLSSVGESRWCLSNEVKKIPLSVECIKQNYDITEPQPQLFVARDFAQLTQVLQEMAAKMAFKVGGLAGVEKAIQAKSVNTVELETGLQISGICDKVLKDSEGNISFLHFSGPTQLSYRDQEIKGQGKEHHSHGFSSPVGPLRDTSWDQVVQKIGQRVQLKFNSGIELTGVLKSKTELQGQMLIASFEECRVTQTTDLKVEVLFDPAWGVFDLAIGTHVVSVYGGPADRDSYGDTSDFVALRVPERKYSETEKRMFKNYSQLRALRDQKLEGEPLLKELEQLLELHGEFTSDWLFLVEAYELIIARGQAIPRSLDLKMSIESKLQKISKNHPETKSVAEDGLKLAQSL